MNKKLWGSALVVSFIGGIIVSNQTMASYVQIFEPVSQTIKAASWNVELEGNLGEQAIRPGRVVSSDVVTLKNDNEHPVKFEIELIEIKDESETAFSDALTFELTQTGDEQVLIGEGASSVDEVETKSIEVTVPGKESKDAQAIEIELISNVEWISSDEPNKDVQHQNQEVTYTYEITATDAFEEENTETPEESEDEVPSIEDDSMEEPKL